MKNFYKTLLLLCLTVNLTSISIDCPSGTALKAVAGYTTNTNGCGSSTLQTLAASYFLPYNDKFQSCCNTHDKCFGTCGTPNLTDSFKDCNSDFKDCTYSKCKQIKNIVSETACKVAANSIYKAVKTQKGENAYLASQKKACSCQ